MTTFFRPEREHRRRNNRFYEISLNNKKKSTASPPPPAPTPTLLGWLMSCFLCDGGRDKKKHRKDIEMMDFSETDVRRVWNRSV